MPISRDKRSQRLVFAAGGSLFEGQVVRALACLVVLVACCLAGPGCAIFKKNTDSKTPSTGSGSPPTKFPTSTDPIINGGSASQSNGGAVLAGRVFDNYSKPPANTSIRLVNMDGKEAGNPTEVSVDANGYFIVQGLKAGGKYRLEARGKNGDHILAGITQTRAPNVTVVIQVKEEFATAGTPDVPGSPAFQDKKPAKTTSLDNPGNGADNRVPAIGLSGPREGEFQLPAVSVPTPGRAAPPALPTTQGWVPAPNLAAADGGGAWTPPLLDIPHPSIRPEPPPLLIPKTPPPAQEPFPAFAADSLLGGPPKVPSCVVVGNRVQNFALNDVNGQPWAFKTSRRGKVVLLDFWSTTCPPCLKTMPSLIRLQTQYGNKGLEVVGIAVESGGSPQVLGFKANAKAQSMHVNYTQLLSCSAVCPVREEFKVNLLPTLVLVDQNGDILWRYVGEPDRHALGELERRIQSKLYAR